jgi:hypothetical protein
MTQVIVVKYRGPTDTRGSRWAATCGEWRISMPYDYALSADANAENAARALCIKAGWEFYGFVSAQYPNGDRVFAFCPKCGAA